MADYSDPLGLLFGGANYFGSPQKSQGLLQLTPQEIERMAAAQSPAFGVFPQMQPYRSQQDITASANVPVDVMRGRIAGTRGLFGDVVNQPIPMVRPLQLLSQALTGQQKYPDTEYYLDTMPLKSDTPVGNVAGRIGSFAPINPMPAVRGVQKLGGLLGEEMATRLNTGRPILPSLLAEPQTAMFAVEPNPSMAMADESSAMRQQLTNKMQALLAQKKIAASAVDVGSINQQIGELQAQFKSLPAMGRVAREVVVPEITAPVSNLGFYSATEQAAINLERSKGTGQSFLNDLMNAPDVKNYEIEAMGLDTYLKGKTNVTRQEVQDFIANNKLDVQERQLGENITEDPIGIAKRKAVFDKYEPQIRALDQEMQQYETNIINARNLASKNLMEANAALNKENLFGSQPIPTTEDYVRYNLAKAESERVNKIPLNLNEFKKRSDALHDARDAEANAAYVVPESTPTKYDKFQLPGGENYRELLLTLPNKGKPELNIAQEQASNLSRQTADLMSEWKNLSEQMPGDPKVVALYQRVAESRKLRDQAENQVYALKKQIGEKTYQSTHFDEPNILAHMRVNDRVDAEGKKMLLIEEVQSDWHQAGRERGYASPEANKAKQAFADYSNELADKYNVNPAQNIAMYGTMKGIKPEEIAKYEQLQAAYTSTKDAVPDAPFKDTWHQLALKRAIKEAVDKGYDRIGLTTGKRQIERYTDELRQNVSEINFQTGAKLTPAESAEIKAFRQQQTYMTGTEKQRYEYLSGKEGAPVNQDETLITAFNGSRPAFTGKVKNGKFIEGPDKALGKTLEEVLGKSIAKQIEEKKTGNLTGGNLTIGGEGMKKYYDEVYPNYLNKLGKRYGAQVGDTTVNVGKVQSKDELAKQLYGNNETYKNLPSEQKRKVDVMFMDMSKDEPVRYLDITPEMKKAVQKGQPLAAVEGMTGLLA